MSVHRFVTDNNCHLIFTPSHCIIKNNTTGKILFQGPTEGSLYPIHFRSQRPPQACFISSASYTLWHQRLGHPSNRVLQQVISSSNLQTTGTNKHLSLCSDCQLGKSTKLSFSHSTYNSTAPLQLIHSYVWGPSPTLSVFGYQYYISFIDDWSRFCWIFPLHSKSEAFQAFHTFKQQVENLFDLKIKSLRCDNGGEYCSTKFQQFLQAHGITQQFSCPYTPEQNGLAERKHRHILDLTRTLFSQSHLPLHFWVEVAQTTVYLINRIPSTVLQLLSPLQKLFNCKPDYMFMRAYGCTCYPWLRPYSKHKLAFRSIPCVFIGYGLQHKGYRCLDPKTGRVYIIPHVTFDETTFPFKHSIPTVSTTPPPSTPLPTFLPLPPSPTVPLPTSSLSPNPTFPNSVTQSSHTTSSSPSLTHAPTPPLSAPSIAHFLSIPLSSPPQPK